MKSEQIPGGEAVRKENNQKKKVVIGMVRRRRFIGGRLAFGAAGV